MEAASALHLNGDALAGSTESEHVAEAAEAAAALDLDGDANTAAAKERPKRRDAVSESQENKNEKTREGNDEIRRLVKERRNTAKGDQHQLKEMSKRIKNASRKDTTDSCIIQRYQKFFMHKIWKEEKGYHESEKRQRRNNHVQKRNCKRLWRILQQTICRNSAWRRSARPSKLGNEKEHREEKLQRRQEKVQAAIDKLKKGKASDNNGIRADDIKTCDATTKK